MIIPAAIRINLFVLLVFVLNSCAWIGLPTKNSPQSKVVAASDSVPATPKAPKWASKKYAYNPSRTLKNDLLHTKLEVEFDWKKRHLMGLATLTLKPHFYPQNTLELDAKGFDIHSTKLLFANHSKVLRHHYNNTKLVIYLDTLFSRNETFTVEIDYTAKPDELVVKGSKAITADKGLYFINPDGTDPDKPKQIWTQGETESSSCWFPTIDSPNERCTQETHITVDSSFVTLSNGKLIYSTQNVGGTRTDVWEQKKPHAPYLFTMVVGKYAVIKDQWQGKEVSYYVEPEYAPYAKAIFGNTPEMIDFFSNKLGVPFAWDKYAQVVVRDFVSGAMENTSASTFMEAVQCDDRALLDQHWDGIIAHELFHQWFGDLVTCESWANLPLNESFANYSEYLWAEYKYGQDEADYEGQQEKQQYFNESSRKREPMIRYYVGDKEDMFDSHSYAKGGRILHMLRKYVGDEAFFESLKVYLTKNQFQSVEIHQLRLAFEEVTGEDLNWFFNQWFLSAGHPELEIAYRYEDKKVILDVVQKQDSLYAPAVYRLPLAVDVWLSGQKRRYNININKRIQSFVLPADTLPQLVLFDGEQQLLAALQQTKTEEELRFQYRYSDKMKARYDALMALSQDNSEETRKLFGEALNDKFWGIRKLAVSSLPELDSASIENNRAKVSQLALSDPKAAVRAEAIEALQISEAAKSKEVFEKALIDRSYSASAAALAGYLKTNASDINQKIALHENEKHPDMLSIIADYYATKGDAKHYDWFIKHLSGEKPEVYSMMQSFGAYLAAQKSIDLQYKGVDFILAKARRTKQPMIRFSAYQALGILSEQPGIKAKMKEIRKAETDPELNKIYEMIGAE